MRQVTFGDGKGYLISRKEFEEKLKQRFDVLKGKHIAYISICANGMAAIEYYDESLIERKGDVFIVPKEKDHKILFFDKKIIQELYGLKKEIYRCEIKCEFSKGKFHGLFLEDVVVDKGNTYYFLNTKGDPYYEVLGGVTEI